jgi:hypothetical protein
MIAGVLDEIRTEHLQNTSLDHYLKTHLFGRNYYCMSHKTLDASLIMMSPASDLLELHFENTTQLIVYYTPVHICRYLLSNYVYARRSESYRM